jgi:hypothetical protein
VAADHLLHGRLLATRPERDPGFATRVDELASAG